MMTEVELLEEVFEHYSDVPDSVENLSIEGLFDVVAHIESKGYFFNLGNKPGYGHYAEFKINDVQCAAISEFCEFRQEAIEDLIYKFLND